MARLDAEERNELPDSAFAFQQQRKLPMEDATHIRNAIARFDQVEDVTDAERDVAWTRLTTAARKHGVEVAESDWREVGR